MKLLVVRLMFCFIVKVDEDTVTRTSTVQVLQPDTIAVDSSLVSDNNKYYGYELDSTDPATVPNVVANGTTIKVYYVIDSDQTKTLSYTVEYYKDNVKVDEDTVTRTSTVQV